MEPEEELILVRRALSSSLFNCVEWIDDKAALRARNDLDNQGLTPEGIKHLVCEYVREHPEAVTQRREEREVWRDKYEFWYRVVVPVEGFRHGLFVEMVLSDDDAD